MKIEDIKINKMYRHEDVDGETIYYIYKHAELHGNHTWWGITLKETKKKERIPGKRDYWNNVVEYWDQTEEVK